MVRIFADLNIVCLLNQMIGEHLSQSAMMGLSLGGVAEGYAPPPSPDKHPTVKVKVVVQCSSHCSARNCWGFSPFLLLMGCLAESDFMGCYCGGKIIRPAGWVEQSLFISYVFIWKYLLQNTRNKANEQEYHYCLIPKSKYMY